MGNKLILNMKTTFYINFTNNSCSSNSHTPLVIHMACGLLIHERNITYYGCIMYKNIKLVSYLITRMLHLIVLRVSSIYDLLLIGEIWKKLIIPNFWSCPCKNVNYFRAILFTIGDECFYEITHKFMLKIMLNYRINI